MCCICVQARHESALEKKVGRARADLYRVEAAHETRAEVAAMADATRKSLFAKLNAAR